jgi:hypothetical protein
MVVAARLKVLLGLVQVMMRVSSGKRGCHRQMRLADPRQVRMNFIASIGTPLAKHSSPMRKSSSR